jgi:hypothetical protein
MTLPRLTITQVDNALGATAPATRNLAIVACSESGTAATPQAFTRASSVLSTFGQGPLTEGAARAINRYGLTVVCVKAAQATAGTVGTLTKTITGTCVPTAAGGAAPLDAYEVVITVVTGGTVGVAGITWTYSLDGGRTTSAPQTQGTGTTLTVPSSGVSFTLGAGTLVAGDTWACPTVAPAFDATSLGAALDALAATATAWDGVLVLGNLTGALSDVVDGKLASMATAGKYHWWCGHFRMANSGESDATYQTAFGSEFNAKSSIYGGVSFGDHWFTSDVSGRVYKRPAIYSVAPFGQSQSEEIDPAELDLGPLPGTQIRDANGNILFHDEAEQPGADDLRAITLRTWDGFPGTYVGNFRLLSPAGSDFQFLQHRRVMNIALTESRLFLLRRLSKATRVNKTTGRILESDRLRIQDGLNGKLRSRLTGKGKASDAYCIVSGDDDLLGGDPLTVQVFVVPLAYPKAINASVGFVNPALQAV